MIDPIAPLRSALSGRYDIEREIGQGGFVTVYLAKDLKHDRAVAIKVLQPFEADDSWNRRFIRGIGLLARLQHATSYSLSEREVDPLRRSARFAAIARRVGLDERIFTSPTDGRPQ